MAKRKLTHTIDQPQTTEDKVNWTLGDPVDVNIEAIEQPEGSVAAVFIPRGTRLTTHEVSELLKSMEIVEEQLTGTL